MVGVDAQPRRPSSEADRHHQRRSTMTTRLACRIEKRATPLHRVQQLALLRRHAGRGLDAASAASAPAPATSRSPPSRRWRRRCRTCGRRRRRWSPATAGRARWSAGAEQRREQVADRRLERLLLASGRAQLVVKCCTMCTSSAIARTITSGGSMLVRMLNVNPISTYRPSVQTQLTSTAPISSTGDAPGAEHARRARRSSAARIGGVSFVSVGDASPGCRSR